MMEQSLTSSVQYYNAHAQEYDTSHSSAMLRITAEVTERTLMELAGGHNRPRRALDFGAGTGTWSVWLAALGWRVDLYDPASAMLAVASEKIRLANVQDSIGIITDDYRQIERRNEPYDLILCLGDVLSYAPDRASVCNELVTTTLVPGGLLVAQVDSYYWNLYTALWRRDNAAIEDILERATTRMGSAPYEFDSRCFTSAELSEFMGSAGLVDVAVRGLHVFAPMGVIDRDEEASYERLMDQEWKMSAEPALIDRAVHLLGVGRRSVIDR